MKTRIATRHSNNQRIAGPRRPLTRLSASRASEIEPLEARIAPATVVVNGTAGIDVLVITATSADGGTYQLTSDGVAGGVTAFSTNTIFTFNAGDASDSLIINNPAGTLFAPIAGIFYNGGSGYNQLNVLGGNADTTVYSVGPTADSGTLVHNQAGLIQRVVFEGLAPITDTVASALVVNGTGAANAISYTQGSVAANGLITIDNFESIEFTNKSSLTINGLGGADTISINNSVTPTGLTGTITVNGGDPTEKDTLVLNGAVGVLDNLRNVPSAAGAGTIINDSAPLPNVLYTGIEHVDLVVQKADGDSVRIEGTTGNDNLEYYQGLSVDSGTFRGGMDSNNATGSGPFDMTEVTFHGVNSAGNDVDVNFFNPGGTDSLVYNGTASDDTLTVQTGEAGGTEFRATVNGTVVGRLEVFNIGSAVVSANAGNDLVTVNSPTGPAGTALTIQGGDSDAGSDVLTYNAPAGSAALIDLGASTIAVSTPAGNSVSYSGFARLNYNGSGGATTLTINGTAGDDSIAYTPTGASAGTVALAGAGPLIAFAGVSGTFTIAPLAGSDSVLVNGTSAADLITVVAGAATTVQVGGRKTVSLGAADVEDVHVDAGGGADTVDVSGTAVNSQVLHVNGGSPASGSPAVSDSLNVTLSTVGVVSVLPGATADAGAVTSADGAIQFGGLEFVNLTGAAGPNLADFQGTNAGDLFSLEASGALDQVRLNDRAVVSLTNFTNVNFAGLFGDDQFVITPGGLNGVIGVSVLGGSSATGDSVILNGTGAADLFLLAATNATDGSAVGAGLPLTYTGTERLIFNGLAGDDLFLLPSAQGRVEISGGAGADRFDFSGSASGVVIDLDAVNVDQQITATGLIVNLHDPVEEFVGSAFNDIVHVKAAVFPRFLFGGTETVVPPGDTFVFNAQGAVSAVLPVDSNTGTIKTIGYADLTYDEFETSTIVNSPSGPGSFGSPGNSDAFATAHIYDQTLFKIGGKPAPGQTPGAVTTGDLNGDGYADMVIANKRSKNISVLINKGDGTFFDPVNIPSGGAIPQDVVIADFDGDAKADVVVANSGSATLGFLKGDGAGNLAAAVVIKTPGFRAYALATDDLNGDAKPDIVAVSRATSTIEVLLGNGAGGFVAAAPIKAGGAQPIDVVIADINADGSLDVATANFSSNNVSFFAGNGAGGLAAPATFGTGIRPTSLAVGDLDNDGKLDIAVSHFVSRFVSVLLGVGNAGGAQFDPQLRVAVSGVHNSESIVVADFDGDGFADIALGNHIGSNFTVLRGLGSATFTMPYEFDAGRKPAFLATGGLAVADLNNDGLLDVIVTSLGVNDVRVLLRNV